MAPLGLGCARASQAGDAPMSFHLSKPRFLPQENKEIARASQGCWGKQQLANATH